jgi:dolichol-phosphate mannosyltransferase
MEQPGPAVSVVLPTYNEADSLPVIVPRIVAALRDAGIECEVIVVDDASPDGTAAVARELALHHPVRVIERRDERGLATAVMRGFAEARAPVCAVMDADGSHPVSALPQMVRLVADDKADIAVGSRNIHGGGSYNWPLFSQVKSKLAAALSFGLTSLTDPTTGFMAVRSSLLPGLRLDPVGWKIVLEVAVKAAPARIAEVPIVFEDREFGESKQNLRVFMQYAQHLAKLYAYRYPTLAELVRFCAVGLLGVCVDLAVVSALKEQFGLDTRLCAIAGFAAAVTSNYLLNRYFTFARGRELPLLWSFFTYVGTNLVGLSVRMATVHGLLLLTELDRGRGYLLTNAIGIALATVFNFAGAKYFAFDPARLTFAPGGGSVPDSAPEPRIGRGVLACAALVLAAALAYTAIDATALRMLTSDDEGVNVTMARNLAHDRALLLRPSVFPGGRRDWVAEDLPALGNTPFFAGLLALLGPFGLPGMGLLPLLSLWAIVLFSSLLLRSDSPRAALYCALLLACSPGFLSLALALEFEPLLTAFCAAGLCLTVKGTRARRRGLCFAGGMLLGLGFLTKMWLIVPYALAACAFVLVQTTLVRAREETPLTLRRSVIAAALGFVSTAGAHLLIVAIAAPDDLPRWLGTVYLGIFSGRGVTGGKLSAAAHYTAAPAWYYPALLFREHFHLLPLSLFGLPALLRRNAAHALAALAMAVGAALALVVLSVPAVKEPLYLLPVLPPLYMLAGVGLAELERDTVKHRPANAATVQAVSVLAVVSAAVVWISYAGDELRISARYAALHTAGMLGCAGVGLFWIARRRLDAALIAGCALALVGFAALRVPAHAHVAARQIAAALRPCVEDAEPAYPSFVAQNSRLLTGYLQRAGRDWQAAPAVLTSDRALAAFVFSPDELADPAFARIERELGTAAEFVELPAPSGYRIIARRARCSF